MIESIDLKNFQAHKDTHIDFDPGINAIVGASTAGKSSIMRAIDWVYRNPRGSAMVSYWNRDKKGEPLAETSATLRVSGHTVSRIKAPDHNGYVVDGEKLGAIGAGTPDQVLKALGLSDISFQSQHSPHFLLAMSSGDVASFLNQTLKLSAIDEVLDKVNTRSRAAKKQEDTVEGEIQTIAKQIRDLDYLDDLLPLVDKLKVAEDSFTTKEKDLKDLVEMEEKLIGLQEDILSASMFLDKVKPLISAVSALMDKDKETTTKLKELATVVNGIEQAELTIDRCKWVLRAKPLVDKVTEFKDKLDSTTKSCNDLATMIKSIKDRREKIVESEDMIESLKSKLPEVCVYCGSAL